MGIHGWFGLIILGFAMHWTINLTLRGRDGGQSDFVMFLSNAATVMVLMGVLGPGLIYIGGTMVLAIGNATNVIGALICLLVGFCAVGCLTAIPLMVTFRFRENERVTIIWMLGAAMEKKIPLVSVLLAFGRQRYDESGRRCQNLTNLLESGVSLDESLKIAGYRLPTEAALAVQFTENREQLGQLFKDSARHAVRSTPEINAILQQILYVAILGVIGILITAFIMLRVVPTMEVIFQDFAIDLPPPTLLLITISSRIDDFGILFFLLFLILAFLILMLGAHYVGWIQWEPRFAHGWTNGFHSAVVQRNLASQIKHGVPIAVAVERLATRYPKPHVRDRLRAASHSISEGADWCDILAREKLLTAAAAQVLKTAQRLGNLDWALQEMADATFRRMRIRLSSILRITMPVIVIGFAIPVGFLAVAIIVPLSELIMQLT